MNPTAEVQPANERRKHPQLRAIYPAARAHVDHLFHHRHEWAGTPIDVLALRVIHEAYPQLHSAEIRTLVAAIERLHEALANQEEHQPVMPEGHAFDPDSFVTGTA
jgi:hypothetical protein